MLGMLCIINYDLNNFSNILIIFLYLYLTSIIFGRVEMSYRQKVRIEIL